MASNESSFAAGWQIHERRSSRRPRKSSALFRLHHRRESRGTQKKPIGMARQFLEVPPPIERLRLVVAARRPGLTDPDGWGNRLGFVLRTQHVPGNWTIRLALVA